jgi:hypothetical protein
MRNETLNVHLAQILEKRCFFLFVALLALIVALMRGTLKDLDSTDLIYFSFTALTTSGFGDIAPALIQSRSLVILEMTTGVMYVAILIARLIGIYQVVAKK